MLGHLNSEGAGHFMTCVCYMWMHVVCKIAHEGCVNYRAWKTEVLMMRRIDIVKASCFEVEHARLDLKFWRDVFGLPGGQFEDLMQADNQSCCFPSRMVVHMQIHDDSNEIYHISSFFRTLAAKTIGLGLCHYGIRRQLFLRTTGPGSNPGRRQADKPISR